jgi:hypothetical protein
MRHIQMVIWIDNRVLRLLLAAVPKMSKEVASSFADAPIASLWSPAANTRGLGSHL